MKKNIFEHATQQIKSRTFYHGSATKIDGDFLEPKEQFNSVQNKRVIGAYHRVDIANLIRQQKSKSIFHKLFNWQKD